MGIVFSDIETDARTILDRWLVQLSQRSERLS